MKSIKKLTTWDLVFIAVFLLIGFFFFYRIGKASINNDAHFWYTRTQNFMRALRIQKWNETYQDPKPGVSVMWLSGVSLETFLWLYNSLFGFRPEIYTYETFPLVHLSVIGPLLLVVYSSVFLLYLVLKKYFDKKLALVSVVLLGFQPFFIGISRSFHSDAVLSAFMLMSFLCATFFLLSASKQRYMVISGILASLAILSKSSAIFMFPYLGLLFLLDFIFKKRNVFFYIKSYLVWLVSLSVFFFAVFPAMWLKPIEILKRIFIYEGMYLVTEGRDGINGFFYYIEPVFRILTPMFIFAFLLGLFFVLKDYQKLKKDQQQILLSVFGFVLFFTLQMSLPKQKMDRYLFPILPFLAVGGGFGFHSLFSLLKNKIKYEALFFLFVLVNLGFLLYFFPNYLIFSSERGKDQFGCSLCSDIGDYLNAKQNPADLKIISVSEKVHRLKPFVKGKVYTTKEELPNNWTADYLVKSTTEPVPDEYSYCVFETNIGFRGVAYWEVYRCK